jgi:two-component system response regulator HydG
MARILVVDDHKNMRVTLALILRREGHDVGEAEGADQAMALLSEGFDLVVTDLRMEPVDGITLLRKVKQESPTTEVIVMTAFGTIDSAVQAMRLGAVDYVTKPFQEAELLVRIQKALEKRALVENVSLLQSEFRERYNLGAIVGNSQAVRDVLSRVLRAAPTDSTVLVTGENGTGKELVARAIHANSKRAEKPFIPVNCAAISENILESELFGHAKGSFTGAISTRKGLMEEADGGTFFFDEIAEMSPSLQAKLLRTIQEHEIRRVGDNRAIKVDVRIIAATNRNLEEEIERGRFRSDLFYRLNVIPIHLPALRERRQDIPLLAAHFLQKFNRKMGRSLRMSEAALARLVSHEYPGNVRELENLIEQTVALAEDEVIGPEHIFLPTGRPSSQPATPRSLDELVALAERRAIEDSLERNHGSLESVARELKLSSTTLWRKMKRYGLSRDRHPPYSPP